MTNGSVNIFERIYYGAFRPVDELEYSESYKTLMDKNNEIHQKFSSLLQKEQLKMFEQMEEMDGAFQAIVQKENYIAGMKAGIHLIIESLYEGV